MIKKLDINKRYEYDNTIQRKINEIISYLNSLELNRIEALNKLSGSKAFDNRKEK